MSKNITLICISKYPYIEEMGLGKYKRGKEYEFPVNIAGRLLRNREWKEVKIDSKSKKNEVKNA